MDQPSSTISDGRRRSRQATQRPQRDPATRRLGIRSAGDQQTTDQQRQAAVQKSSCRALHRPFGIGSRTATRSRDMAGEPALPCPCGLQCQLPAPPHFRCQRQRCNDDQHTGTAGPLGDPLASRRCKTGRHGRYFVGRAQTNPTLWDHPRRSPSSSSQSRRHSCTEVFAPALNDHRERRHR